MSNSSASGVIVNARVLTQDVSRPTAEAVSWVDGRIAYVGSNAEVLGGADGLEVMDLAGAVVVPGFIDSHSHPVRGAELARGRDLGDVETFAEYLDAMGQEARAARRRNETWVFGWNLDYSVLGDRELLAVDLDHVTEQMPVVVMMHDVHTVIASSAALAAAGVTGAETFGEEAQVVVDGTGRPTGELREAAAYQLVYRAAPPDSLDARCDRAMGVLSRMAASGLTGCVLMDGTLDTLSFLEELERRHDLPVKIDVALWHEPSRDDAGMQEFVLARQRRGRRWRTGLIKLFADGVVETGTAWLHEPDGCGGSITSAWHDQDRFAEVVAAYADAGFQIATHAIGDRAVSEVLDVYEKVGPVAGNGAGHRIEHIETLLDRDVARFGKLGVVASMQPLQMQWRRADGSDRWSARMGPARAARAYRTRDLMASGGTVVLGSDWPVTSFDPRVGMAWARCRTDVSDAHGVAFEPEQRMSGDEVLASYTRTAAAALGDTTRGTIAPLRAADLTVFDRDPTSGPADQFTATRVLATFVDGVQVHGKEA